MVDPISIAGDAVSLASTGLVIAGAAVPIKMMNKLADDMGTKKRRKGK
jgi:hypothetical protein